MGFDLGSRHPGVCEGALVGEAGTLPIAGGHDPLADGGRGLGGFVGANLGEREGGGLDVDVDPVEKRPADAGAVAFYLRGRASAPLPGVAQVAAGAGIHGRHQHERAGKGQLR